MQRHLTWYDALRDLSFRIRRDGILGHVVAGIR